MRRIAIIYLTIVMLLVPIIGAGCGSDGDNSDMDEEAIEATIDGYMSSYNASDFDECITYFTGYDDEEDAKSQLEFLRGLSGEIANGVIKVSHTSTAGQSATTTVSFTIYGQEDANEMQLKKVDGEWKILWDEEW